MCDCVCVCHSVQCMCEFVCVSSLYYGHTHMLV